MTAAESQPLRVLRALGVLLTYPRADWLAALDELGSVIANSPLLGRAHQQRLAELLVQLAHTDALELEERYVGLFERGRGRSLHLFEHVHGESRDRGQAMVDLLAVYERAGLLLAPGELPDYLPAVLEYLSCRTAEEARDMLADCAHILRALGERLATDGSGYAAVLDAVLAVGGVPGLDWNKIALAAPEPDTDPDADWMDAPAFGPNSQCHNGAQPTRHLMPDTAQPAHHRRTRS